MNDELDALLRGHYRAAADEIHADPETVRGFQEAGRAPAPEWRGLLRRWAIPVVAAAVTAAVVVTVAVLLWPGAGRPEPARPLTPSGPSSPASPAERRHGPVPVPSFTPTAPKPYPASPSSPVPPSVSTPDGSEPSTEPATPPGAGVRDGPGA